ncbi:MAG: alpha-galactosidase [Eubacteriales bacterium]|nr:alpha-galactosidase [Eubacteriales bacterium]
MFTKLENQIHFHYGSSSLIFEILEDGQIGFLYFGEKLPADTDLRNHQLRGMHALSPVRDLESLLSHKNARLCYAPEGHGDYSTPAFRLKHEDGSPIFDLRFQGLRRFDGSAKLSELPSLYASDTEAETLVLEFEDKQHGVGLELYFSLFSQLPLLASHSRFYRRAGQNEAERIRLCSASSLCLDLNDADYELVRFHGAWGRERYPQTQALHYGVQSLASRSGTSSAEALPALILKRPSTDEFQGLAYGASLLWSGSHCCGVDVSETRRSRLFLGLHPDQIEIELCPGAKFETPEAIFAYSNTGLNGLSSVFHRFYFQHLISPRYRKQLRPILLNNWEATYFDFNEEKLLDIARRAKQAGIELFVLDDGWFGERNDDRRSLGDWQVNYAKLPNGLDGLAKKIVDLGLDFGLWIEPEMVNPDSELYRQHPDYVLADPRYSASLGRYQLVLDFSRVEVVDAIYEQLHNCFKSLPLHYVKWDMNRYFSEAYSQGGVDIEATCRRQGRLYYDYVRGVYSLYEKLQTAFPDILFESCSSGGARYDLGLFHYAPQAWCSDNSDARARLEIQTGSSYFLPPAALGAHVSAAPNHQLGRNCPLRTRAYVAFFGAFGYELDLSQLSDEDLNLIRELNDFYTEKRALFQLGQFERIILPFGNAAAAFMVWNEERSEAALLYYQKEIHCNTAPHMLRLENLSPTDLNRYRIHLHSTGEKLGEYPAQYLRSVGLLIPEPEIYRAGPDDAALLFLIERIA